MKMTLGEIEAVIRRSWSAETAYAKAGSLARAPELAERGRGQCGATALVVQDLLGGELVIADVTTAGITDTVHYWNRLGTTDIDLTRDQFLADEIVGAARVVRRPAEGLRPGAARDAYQLLRTRVYAALEL